MNCKQQKVSGISLNIHQNSKDYIRLQKDVLIEHILQIPNESKDQLLLLRYQKCEGQELTVLPWLALQMQWIHHASFVPLPEPVDEVLPNPQGLRGSLMAEIL